MADDGCFQFVGENWMSVRRTRKVLQIHLLSSMFPLIYIAVYAEAQRRDGDNKEFGASSGGAFVKRAPIGVVMLNTFYAWCRHAIECVRALKGDVYGSASPQNAEGRGGF